MAGLWYHEQRIDRRTHRSFRAISLGLHRLYGVFSNPMGVRIAISGISIDMLHQLKSLDGWNGDLGDMRMDYQTRALLQEGCIRSCPVFVLMM